MAALKCEIVRQETEGRFPCVVRTPDGRVLRLHGDAAPRHARWLGLCEGVAVWSEPAEAAGPGLGAFLEIDIAELIDEVGVPLGPDRDVAGLFDPPSEASLTGERTGVATEEAGAEQQRTAVLAWISATLGEPVNLPADGPPCAALRTRIADEPPDMLPSLGFPAVTRDGRVLRPPPPVPGPAASFADDTVTQVDLLVAPPSAEDRASGVTGATTTGATTTGSALGRWFSSDRLVRLAPGVAFVLLAASALAWWAWA